MSTENQTLNPTTTDDAHAPRFDVYARLGAPAAALARTEERIQPDATIKELVKLRASQINGCAHLVMQIATINAWNRVAVTARSVPASWNAA
jgi:alkylhydroperoxidase family enzyme